MPFEQIFYSQFMHYHVRPIVDLSHGHVRPSGPTHRYMVTCDLSHSGVRPSGHITWIAVHVICHTVTSNLTALQPGGWSTSPGAGPHLCPVQAAEPVPATWRTRHLNTAPRKTLHSHAAGVICTPTQHLYLWNPKKIAHQRWVIKYTIYVFSLCVNYWVLHFFVGDI